MSSLGMRKRDVEELKANRAWMVLEKQLRKASADIYEGIDQLNYDERPHKLNECIGFRNAIAIILDFPDFQLSQFGAEKDETSEETYGEDLPEI